jgi:cytochrome bd-type quinol oxidase subunit 1
LGTTISAGSIFIVEGWIQTPAGAFPSPAFTVTVYNDGPSRILKTFTVSATGLDVQSIQGFAELHFVHNTPKAVHVNDIADFRFNISGINTFNSIRVTF